MKTNIVKNMQKTQKNNSTSKGGNFGFKFSDALFNMKSLEMDYNDLQG
jgi:hypothetical protein